MDKKHILEEAIQQAIDGGWDSEGWDAVQLSNEAIYGSKTPYEIIFTHDFARALWGEELHHTTFVVPKELNKKFAGTNELDIKPIWQYHLQKMVIADDPIEYLGQHIVQSTD